MPAASADRYPVNLLTPSARPRPRFPFRFAALGLLSLGAAFALTVLRGPLPEGLSWLLHAGALSGAIALGAWVEDRLYTALASRSGALRITAGLLMPPLALLAGLAAVMFLSGALGAWWVNGGMASAAALAAFAWMASAAVGSLIIVLLDVAISTLVRGLRLRITLAVLALIVLVTGLALGLAHNVPILVERLLDRAPEQVARLMGASVLSRTELHELLGHPDNREALGLALFALAAIAGLPAVLSACTKLAEAVMERMHPLAKGFAAVARGKLNVQVEEAGSVDFIALSRSFNQMVSSLADARRMEQAFGQYVSSHVMERIRAQHGEAAIPASLRRATVFFADVRGFTAMSERLAPATVLELLNRYFERVVPVVEKHEGYLDKFIGDAMVVVFNGPFEQPDHAERAVRCALALLAEVDALNRAKAFPEVGEVQIGIGVATGPLVAGNLGSVRKLEYTVIGDTVNLASRLTSLAGAGEIWINDATAEALPADLPRVPIGPIKVKGKEQPVVVYRVALADAPTTISRELPAAKVS